MGSSRIFLREKTLSFLDYGFYWMVLIHKIIILTQSGGILHIQVNIGVDIFPPRRQRLISTPNKFLVRKRRECVGIFSCSLAAVRCLEITAFVALRTLALEGNEFVRIGSCVPLSFSLGSGCLESKIQPGHHDFVDFVLFS